MYKPLHIDRLDQSFAQVRFAAVKSLPLGMMSSSSNGRELKSRYFQYKGRGEFVDAIQNSERRYAKITILNERRPYDLEILVLVERREPANTNTKVKYTVVGQDIRLAKVIKDHVLRELAKRREDMNIIDDFRVF